MSPQNLNLIFPRLNDEEAALLAMYINELVEKGDLNFHEARWKEMSFEDSLLYAKKHAKIYDDQMPELHKAQLVVYFLVKNNEKNLNWRPIQV